MEALAEAGEVAVALEQVLEARERRAARQAGALARFGWPIVSMTVVMPGPIKDGRLPRRLLSEALCALEGVAARRAWPVLVRETLWQETGPEALYIVGAPAELLKAATIDLEDRHPLGRLWDLDVIAPGEPALSRRAFGCPSRRCLMCERPAFECARSRAHPLPELLEALRRTVDEHDLHRKS